MTFDERFPERLPLVVELRETEINRHSLQERDWVSDNLRESLAAANVIIVPWEGFRGLDDPVFPVGTGELFNALREVPQQDIRPELAVTDERYSEVALHADIVITPTILVSTVVVPIIVNLVSEWLKGRLLERAKEADVKFEMVLEEPDGRTKLLKYEGPVSSFESLVSAQLRQDASLISRGSDPMRELPERSSGIPQKPEDG